MRKSGLIYGVLALTVLLGACGTSNDVVSNRLISKRKYTKGFFINKKSNLDTQGEEEVAETPRGKERRSSESTVQYRTAEVAATEHTTSSEETVVASTNRSAANDGVESSATTTQRTSNATPVVSTSNEVKSKKEVKKEVRAVKKANSSAAQGLDPSNTAHLIILIILCFILPPLAIFLYRGADNIFWIDLILFLIAVVGWWFFPFAGLAGLAAFVIALLAIFDII